MDSKHEYGVQISLPDFRNLGVVARVVILAELASPSGLSVAPETYPQGASVFFPERALADAPCFQAGYLP